MNKGYHAFKTNQTNFPIKLTEANVNDNNLTVKLNFLCLLFHYARNIKK